MTRYVVIENLPALESAISSELDERLWPSVHLWLWDDARPNERVYAAGDSPAYMPGDRPGSLSPWKPGDNEVAFPLPDRAAE